MDYSILGPIKYPGPARNMSILSGCLWFKNDRGIGTARFFAYDAYSTFSFGYSDTSLVATVKSSSESRCVFPVYLTMFSKVATQISIY